MKRILFFCMLSFILCGCAAAPFPSKNTGSDRRTDVDMEIQTSGSEPASENSPLEEKSYDKWKVENRDIDIWEMMAQVHSGKQLELFKRKKTGEWAARIDGINHSWEKTENSILYRNDKKIKKTGKEHAGEIAEDFIQRFCASQTLSFVKEDEKRDGDGCYTFCYVQSIEGIPVMGNRTVYLPNYEEKAMHGSYIEITVDRTGIVGLFLQQAFDRKETVKSYQAEKDFISQNQILEAAKEYYERSYADLKEKTEMEIQDITVIYMPYEEEKVKYLIPVYDVTIHEKERNTPICMLMDAVTAYVYYAQ